MLPPSPCTGENQTQFTLPDAVGIHAYCKLALKRHGHMSILHFLKMLNNLERDITVF